MIRFKNGEKVMFDPKIYRRVASWLKSHGFLIANIYKERQHGEPYEYDMIGIISGKNPLKNNPFWKWFYKIGIIARPDEYRRIYIGSIWFDNKSRNATENNWVFDVYGEAHMLKDALTVASGLEQYFNINIRIRPITTREEYETFDSDYGL